MTRVALNRAYQAAVRQAFDVLLDGMISGNEAEAVERFHRAVALALKAHWLALNSLDAHPAA